MQLEESDGRMRFSRRLQRATPIIPLLDDMFWDQCFPEARTAFKALDDNALRVSLKLTKRDMGEQKEFPIILPRDFVRALDAQQFFTMSFPDCLGQRVAFGPAAPGEGLGSGGCNFERVLEEVGPAVPGPQHPGDAFAGPVAVHNPMQGARR